MLGQANALTGGMNVSDSGLNNNQSVNPSATVPSGSLEKERENMDGSDSHHVTEVRVSCGEVSDTDGGSSDQQPTPRTFAQALQGSPSSIPRPPGLRWAELVLQF